MSVFAKLHTSRDLWHRGAVVITTAQLHSAKPELRFCAGSNGVSEIRDGEDLWQWSRLEIRLNAFRRSTIPQKQFITCANYHLINFFPSLIFFRYCKKRQKLKLNSFSCKNSVWKSVLKDFYVNFNSTYRSPNFGQKPVSQLFRTSRSDRMGGKSVWWIRIIILQKRFRILNAVTKIKSVKWKIPKIAHHRVHSFFSKLFSLSFPWYSSVLRYFSLRF